MLLKKKSTFSNIFHWCQVIAYHLLQEINKYTLPTSQNISVNTVITTIGPLEREILSKLRNQHYLPKCIGSEIVNIPDQQHKEKQNHITVKI